MKISRLIQIIYILLNKQRVTAGELAEHFEVSTRTIYRDVDAISSAGVPIYTERGSGGGISLLPNYVLSKSILSEQEQNEILTALQGLSNMGVGGTKAILQKLSAVFDMTVADWLEIDFSDWGYENNALFNDLKTAIIQRCIVEFEYYGRNGEKTRRRVEPVQLLFKSKAWYLKGFCLTREDMRLFKLTRVWDLVVTDEGFSKRSPPLAPISHDPHERRVRKVALRLKIAPEMTYRILDELPGKEMEEHPDGSVTVTATWRDDNWLYGLILSFGEYIEVLSPEHIRKNMLEKSKAIYRKYSSNCPDDSTNGR